MTKKAKKQGFTLVEIMIVVAIIGLLAAIGIPSFKAAREGARSKACLNNLRMIASGAEQYMMLSNKTTADIGSAATYIKGGLPTCPSGNGAYTLIVEEGEYVGNCPGTHGTIANPTAGSEVQ